MIYQKALTMNTDDDFYTFLPLLYTKMAEAFKNLSDWFNAQKYFELAVEFYVSTGDTEKICENKYEIANLYYITFKHDRAEKLLNEIISEDIPLTLQVKSKLLLTNITGQWYIDEFTEEFNLIDKSVLSEMYFKYAVYLDKNGDTDKSVRYYKKCVETSQDRLVHLYLSASLTNLASIYDEEGKTDMAVRYLHESLRLDELSKNYNGIYISAMKLADINKNKNSQKRIEYLEKARTCAVELNEKFYIASSNVALGDFYYEKKSFSKALNYYEEAQKMGDENLSKENLVKVKIRINEIGR